MRRCLALAVLLAAATTHADDPHDLFGVGGTKKAAPEPKAASADPLDDAAPALTESLSADYLRRLPVADATHDAVAGYGLGASRDDVGVSFGGATGLENRWTLDGAPIDSLITGGAGLHIPLSFLSSLRMSAGGFSARDRTSTGGVIDAQLRKGSDKHEVEATVWGGITADSRRRPSASGSFTLRRLAADTNPDVSAAVVATGPVGEIYGGHAWYAAGIAPSLGSTAWTWKTARPIDADGDGAPDGFPGQIITQQKLLQHDTTGSALVPAMARLGWDKGVHHVELTLIGEGAGDTRFLSNATMQAAGVDRRDGVADGIATWRGTWKRTHAMIQLAWHRSVHRESAHDGAGASTPQLLSAYVPMSVPEEPALQQLCADTTYPLIAACPVPFGYFASGGAGPLVDVVGDRPTATAEISHRLTDRHTLRAGATLEDSRLVQTSRFTGGEQVRSLIEGVFDSRLRYYDGQCELMPLGTCDYASSSTIRFRTRYAAAYAEDTWAASDDIKVDGGLRWELMQVGPHLLFSHELAPRAGLTYAPRGGSWRAWTTYGRSFAMLPAGLGPTVIRRDATVTETTTTLSPTNQSFSRDVDNGAPYVVHDGIEPMAQDELTAGLAAGFAKYFQATVWTQGRWLRRGLETTTTGFDNPGRYDGLPARRNAATLAVEIATDPTAKTVIRAGYLYGTTFGNYLGAYDPRQGMTSYAGDAFDGSGDAALRSANEMGRLPTDIGHRLFVELDRGGKLGPVGLEVAARLTLASGRPRNAFADSDIGVIDVVQRGSLGRGPTLSQANVRVAAHWQGFDVTLDVFNTFDRGDGVQVDETYTDAFVRPIEGGSYADLIWLKTTDGHETGRRTAFGLPYQFQPPVSAVLGVHHAF